MKTFGSLADALDNGDVQALNKIGNTLGVQFGNDKVGNVKIAASALGGELGRAFDGAGVVGSERKEWEDKLSPYLANGQFKGAIQTADSLLAGKQKSAEQSFKKGIQAKPNFGDQGGAQGGGQPQSGAPTPIPKPDNATHTGISSVDGKKYWLDKDQKKLGLAQ
jgi:hypothetical protein